jgi:hypothetical protein
VTRKDWSSFELAKRKASFINRHADGKTNYLTTLKVAENI